MAVFRAYESYIIRVQSMFWIHALCELVSETFRTYETLDRFTLRILYPFERFFYSFYDLTALLAPVGSGVPYLAIHVGF